MQLDSSGYQSVRVIYLANWLWKINITALSQWLQQSQAADVHIDSRQPARITTSCDSAISEPKTGLQEVQARATNKKCNSECANQTTLTA